MFEGLKKFGMKLMWRMQAIGSLYSVVMLTITLTLVVLPLVSWRFLKAFETLGFDLGQQADLAITAIIFVVIVAGALTVGFAYDRVFKLWKTQNQVAVERNPYAKNYMNPKEVLNWQYCWIPLLRASGYPKEAEFMEKWNNRCLAEDPLLRNDVDEILRWVDGYKMGEDKGKLLAGDIASAVKKARKAS